MGGKTSTSTSQTQVPADVLSRYDSVNASAQQAAATPFQSYSSDPSAFVAPLTGTQQAGIQNANTATQQAQPYYDAAAGNLLGAQNTALPFYGQAQDSLQSGLAQAHTAYGQSNDDMISGLNNASALQTPAQGLAVQGTQAVNAQQIGAGQINQFMSPYLGDVLQSTEALQNQSNQQAQSGQLGTAIQSGAFGGDRAGVAAANLAQQQNLANSNVISGIANTGYNNALGAAQQQQGVNLSAGQANRAALQEGSTQLGNLGQQAYTQGMGASQQLASDAQGLYGLGSNTATGLENIGQGQYGIGSGTATSLAGLGAGAQSAALQGATAQLTAGQQEQSTQQAGLTSLYNQFLQQQAYPFQTSQFLANVAEGTGSLSGSTTSTTQPTGLFGNLLSDRRSKENIRKIGEAKNGLPIYSFRYKGDPEKVTHIGFMADEVEKKHPEAVGLAGGLKTVDYDRASRAEGGQLMFDPSQGEYGLGAASMPGKGGYVPSSSGSPQRRIAFQSSPPVQKPQGLAALANDYNSASNVFNTGKGIAVGSANGNSTGLFGSGGNFNPSTGYFADGGEVGDDDLTNNQELLRLREHVSAQAPDSANGPVTGALASQAAQPKYGLNHAPGAPGQNGQQGGLGQLASIATTGNTIANLGETLASALAFNKGGLVPREHHADGSSVGGDDDYLAGLGLTAPDASAPTVASNDDVPMPAKRPKGLAAAADVPMPPARPKNLGLDPDSISTDAVQAAPDFDASKLDNVPTPPARPQGLSAPASMGQAPQAGLAPAANTQDVPSFLIGRESGGKFNATNQTSAAYGLGQFTPDTAKTVAARHPDLPPLNDFYSQDPNIGVPAQKAYVAAHAQDQAKVLTANGIEPSAQNIHMNWFLGESGGPAFLKAMQQNPDTPGVSLAQPDQVAANKTIFYNHDGSPKTAAQVYASINGGASQGGGGLGGALSSIGNSISNGVGNIGHAVSHMFGGDNTGQPSQNGQPQSGGMGERALMGVLSGLGAVGSYRGQSVLGAALQGLGAGAQGYMNAGNTQATIANTQAEAGLHNAMANRERVNAARDSVLSNGMVLGPDGNVHTISKDIAGPGVQLYGGRPTLATTTTPSAGSSTPPASSVTPPVAPSGIDLTGVGYDRDSAAKAKNEVLVGPQASQDLDQSAAYQDSARKASAAAQSSAPYTRTLASTLADAYQQTGINAPGATFAGRAGVVSYLNTMARALGQGDNYFGDSDKGQTLESKVNTLQAAARAQGADEHTLGALNAFKGANATLEQSPQASSEIAARLMTDQMRSQDQYKHAEQWKADSPTGTVLGAQDDFQTKNGPQKYDNETRQLQTLMLNQGKFFQGVNSGKFSPSQVAQSLKKHGFDPSLARYFGRGN